MPDFRTSRLYRTSLGEDSTWGGEQETRRLVTALDRLREHAAAVAARIAFDLPDFTSHDVGHIDALWMTADQIALPEYRFTPTEGFSFGAAALVHDLGLALAAYVEGPDSLRTGEHWEDALLQAVSRELGHAATRAEIADASPAAERAATAQLLRQLHAGKAPALITSALQGPGGPIWLLEDQDLRQDTGWLIGTVAASHWWDTSALVRTFANRGGHPKDFPSDWTIDPLKLACLLRLADAAHLDGTRARSLQQALQHPSPASEPHWTFQRLLHPVRRDGDQLVFESTRPFRRDEAEAWWLCLDTLRAADRELRAVDALLADTRLGFRFAARSVAGVNDPRRLAELVHTEAWSPVDARLHVSDIPSLVERLGGRQLYGDDPHVSLRELLQNAQDAVRARAAFVGRAAALGSVLVSEGRDEDGHWLSVSDDGVGMPVETLTGSLLDFGVSGWQSHELADRLPGLLSRGFRPTGRFGIGFASVFMGNRRVQVVSRALDASAADTNVLEFFNGAAGRPLLRPANEEERLPGPGTTVRIWPAHVERPERRSWDTSLLDDLGHLTAWLCPAPQTDVKVRRRSSSPRVARAGDWLRLDPVRLLRRIVGDSDPGLGGTLGRSVVERMRPMEQDGAVVGRAALTLGGGRMGVMTVGGFRVSVLDHVAGVVLGHAPNLARDTAVPLATRATLATWASEQRDLLCQLRLDREEATRCAALLYALGVGPGRLPICRTADGPLSYDDLLAWSHRRERIVLFDDGDDYVEDLSMNQRSTLRPAADVVVYTSQNFGSLSWFRNAGADRPAADGSEHTPNIYGLINQAITEAWTHYWEIEEPEGPAEIGRDADGAAVRSEFRVELERIHPDDPWWLEAEAEAEELAEYADPPS